MNDLVEKVEEAIVQAIQRHGHGRHMSRAAIKAVAEWIGPEYCVTQGNLLNQIKEK